MDAGDVPRFILAQPDCCWPMTGMLITLSAEAPTWLPKAVATAIPPASTSARRANVGLRNLTKSEPCLHSRTKRRPSCGASQAQTNDDGDPRWPGGQGLYPSAAHGWKKASMATAAADRCNGRWTRSANRYVGSVKEQTRPGREGPSA